MVLNAIKKRKEILLFLLMFVAFTFFASIRVDNLERNSVYSANEKKWYIIVKDNLKNFFSNNALKNRVMVKLWDEHRKKWYFKIVDVKKEEKNAVISYNELLKKLSSRKCD